MNEPIKDKAPKPPGLLPKNVQSWVIVGIAVLMIVIMWLTGGKKPQATAKSSTSSLQPPVPVEVNETKITELQNRIQDLQRQQLVAQSALAQQTRLLGSTGPDQFQAQAGAAPTSASAASPEDEIKAERRKREYLSLFASNVALSYRKDAFNSAPPAKAAERPADPTQTPESPQLAQLLKDTPPFAVAQQPTASQANATLSSPSANQSASPTIHCQNERTKVTP
jgi:hypothetical protein